MPDVSVRPMTPAEFDQWRYDLARRFADSKVAAGTWTAEGALEKALRGNDALLPAGLATEGMLLLKGLRPDDGTPIGRLWIGLQHPQGAPGCAFLYDIEVEPGFRGAGYGRALLAAAERAARERGLAELELNVFGDNPVAIALYASAGYAVVTQQMRKTL
ncbi:GNAT family N-acetyltransferase [Phytohabitans suffuscus]|uniref:N-acetyltransferase n=1 Tax=Phytohabitans suffuscus TaxID=624315 RepID=A0A6F8YWI4_9ACTN|nr:GNAT family N-acetyltransferase [Phytohabitans suffuscus]BCB90211.1 N-acetyltransferase [Phytohabitans suffuscus]